MGCALAFFLAGAGCQTSYRRLVSPFPNPPLPPSIVELGAVSVGKKKVGILHQPSVNAAESEVLAKAALRQIPEAEFFSDYQINAVLHIYPLPRLPVFYCLDVQISGMAARTNSASAGPVGGKIKTD